MGLVFAISFLPLFGSLALGRFFPLGPVMPVRAAASGTRIPVLLRGVLDLVSPRSGGTMPGHDAQDMNDHSVLKPVSAPEGRSSPQNVQTDAETVAEGAGGFLAGVSGLAIGAVAGPVGALLGGLAGVVGGWWAGREVAHAITEDHDELFRSQYEQSPDRLADRTYEQVRPAYVVGHLAGLNPEYQGRSFEDVEGDLRSGWSDHVVAHCGEWPVVRGYARTAFDRARGASEK
jgi:hypothetical protein